MTDDREDLLRGALRIRQPDAKEGLRVNIDTILLAHFTKPERAEKIIELGCAHGAISLILARRGLTVEGIDIQGHLVKMAAENASENGLADNAKFYRADLREYRKNWAAQSYDRVVVNPPYDEPCSSKVSPSRAVAAAMQGTMCTLDNAVAAAHWLLKNKGRLDIVMRAGRLCELMNLLRKYSLEPKIMMCVHPKPSLGASVVLIEAMRAAKKGMRILRPLFILDDDGRETQEMLENYNP